MEGARTCLPQRDSGVIPEKGQGLRKDPQMLAGEGEGRKRKGDEMGRQGCGRVREEMAGRVGSRGRKFSF